ncbi:MAG TPA: hypothetical protein VGO62_16690 [Myxococcota bacterium]
MSSIDTSTGGFMQEIKEQGGFLWDQLGDVVIDAQGRYVVASCESYDQPVTITCFTAALEPVWQNAELKVDGDEVRLTAAPDGRVFAWQQSRHSAQALSADGKALGKIGGREPASAKVPFLDFADADDCIVDADGTYLLVVNDRLQRFDKDGHGVHTWPQSGGLLGLFKDKLQPLYVHRSETERSANEYDSSGVTYWKKRPLALYSNDVRGVVVGGALYLLTDRGMGGNAVGKLDREGHCLWSVSVPDIDRARPAVDRAGNVYVATDRAMHHEVYKIDAAGTGAQVHCADWRNGGPVEHPHRVTALPDGTVGLWDSDRKLTIIGPDKQVRLQTREAKQSIDDKRAARDRKIELDEDVD